MPSSPLRPCHRLKCHGLIASSWDWSFCEDKFITTQVPCLSRHLGKSETSRSVEFEYRLRLSCFEGIPADPIYPIVPFVHPAEGRFLKPCRERILSSEHPSRY